MENPTSGPGGAPDRGPARASASRATLPGPGRDDGSPFVRATLPGPGLDDGAPIVWPAVFRFVRSALRAHGPTAWGPLDPRWFDQILDAWIDLWSACAARANRHWDLTAPLDLGLYASACMRHAEVVEGLMDLDLVSRAYPLVVKSPLCVALQGHIAGRPRLFTLTLTPARKEVERGL